MYGFSCMFFQRRLLEVVYRAHILEFHRIEETEEDLIVATFLPFSNDAQF